MFSKHNICKDNRFDLVETNLFLSCRNDFPPLSIAVQEKKSRNDFLPLPLSFLARTKKTWVDTIFIVMLGWVSDLTLAY